MMRTLLISLSLLAITACSNVPKNIQSAPLGDTQVNDVLLNQDVNEGKMVRWGGEIIAVENSNDSSMIQVVQFPLNHYGKPNPTKPSSGRFLARTDAFIDPAVHKEGDLITFSGMASNEIATRKIDEKDLPMPIMDFTDSYKWQPYKASGQNFYYDPFFYPNNRFNRFYYGYGHPRFGFSRYRYFY